MPYNSFFSNKTFFWLSLNFLSIKLEIKLRFSYFFLNFISWFSLILYFIRFNTNNKCHFVNNGEKKKLIGKIFTQFWNFWRALVKISIFSNFSLGIWAGDFLNIFWRFLAFWGSFSYKDFLIKMFISLASLTESKKVFFSSFQKVF